jgi:hypothetical protein
VDQQKKDDASGSAEIPTIEQEIGELTALRNQVRSRADELLRTEDPTTGVFHNKELFDLKQDSLRLEVEIQVRRNKINRIRLAEEPENFG